MIQELTDSDFKQVALSSQKTVLVKFGAEWCGPCKKLVPVLEELNSEINGNMLLVTVDVDNSPETALKYGIMSIPTMIILKDGIIKEQLKGFVSKATLQKKLDGYSN